MHTKQPGREADHSPPSSANIKNGMHRDNFIFTLHNTISIFFFFFFHIVAAHTQSVAAPVGRKLVFIVTLKIQASEPYFNKTLGERNNTDLLSMQYKHNHDFGFHVG
jgi:hypothetical protein